MSKLILSFFVLVASILLAHSVFRSRNQSIETQRVRSSRLILQVVAKAHDKYLDENKSGITASKEIPLLHSCVEQMVSQLSHAQPDIANVRNELERFVDAWGQPLVISQVGAFRIELVSVGADGIPGSSDDLTVSLGPYATTEDEEKD